MRGKAISMIIILVLLVGCANKNEMSELTEQNKDIERLKQLYEDDIKALSLSKEKEINSLNDRIKELELEIEGVLVDYKKMKKEKDSFKKVIDEENAKSDFDDNDIYLEDKIIRLYSEGEDYLEDGIICTLEVLDSKENMLWHRQWEGLQVTELATYSPVAVASNRIYIVIGQELNAIDINTGEIRWDSIMVGSSGNAPVVDVDGCIYTTGQYVPYLTAVSSDGNIKWQIESEDMYGIYDLSLCNEYLAVKQNAEIILFDKDGNKIEQ